MHVTRFVADALSVLTICLVAVLILLGLFCILYSFYFRNLIRGQGFPQLGYFSGPWVIRIILILFAIWWGVGEIIRLNFLRKHSILLYAQSSKLQEAVCKCYIVSNLGFAEPCFFLTLVFLLRASLLKSGTLGKTWNRRTAGLVLLYCLPFFVSQLTFIVISPKLKGRNPGKLGNYLTSTATTTNNTTQGSGDDVVVVQCTYPLFSTILLGLFGTILTAYLFLIGRRLVHLVINKGLQKRIYILIFSISGLFPLRIIFLGLSVLFKPGQLAFEVLAFLAFLSLLCCVGVGICMLVYFPVADSLALRNLHKDIEATGTRISDEHNVTVPLIANQSPPDDFSSGIIKPGSSRKRDEEASGAFVELSFFSSSGHI